MCLLKQGVSKPELLPIPISAILTRRASLATLPGSHLHSFPSSSSFGHSRSLQGRSHSSWVLRSVHQRSAAFAFLKAAALFLSADIRAIALTLFLAAVSAAFLFS